MVAPGSVTAGRYGLVEYHVAPHSPGAAPHFHQTFSESFYVLTGQLTVYHAGSWDAVRPGRLRAGARGRARTASATTATSGPSFLILFAPGIAREKFFLEMAELRRSGRTLTPEQMTAFYARHDQVMVDA